jgi:hypothetical protein
MLSSSRLNFRPCTDADVDLLLEHWTEAMVRRYLFDDRITDRETVARFMELNSALFQNRGRSHSRLLPRGAHETLI